jgi:RNA polymerase sigma-70 factor, ECF subfamily
MTATSDADRELAGRIARAGDDAAAAERELCRRWAPRIAGYGARHLRERQSVDDLLQRVLLAVVQALRTGRVEDPDRIGGYILTTCRRTTWEMNRGAWREAGVVSDAALEEIGVEPEWRTIDRAALDRCLGRLPTRERVVIVGTFCDELSSDRIAAHLTTTAGHVRVIRHRALAQLQSCMEGR